MTVSRRVENRDKRDDVWIVRGDKLVGPLVLPQVLEFVDYYVHSAASWLPVHLLVEPRC